MDTTINSRNSSDSTFSCKDSSSEINLNNAMLMSISDEIFANPDETFYDAYEAFSPSWNIETNIAQQNNRFSNLFEHSDSTTLISLPCTKIHSNYKNDKHTDSMQNSNLRYRRDTEKNYETNKHVPLRVLLRRMFDQILGRHTNCTKKSDSTCSTKSSTNESLLNNSNLLTNKFERTLETSNDNSLYQIQEFNDKIVTSNVQNSSKIDVSFTHDTSISFSSETFSKKLVTILEESNESSNNSQLQSSLNWSGRCVGILRNFSFQTLGNKHWLGEKKFNTSDMNDSQTTISSNISNDIEILNREICQMTNNLQSNNALICVSQNINIVNDNDTNNEDYDIFSSVSLDMDDEDSCTRTKKNTEPKRSLCKYLKTKYIEKKQKLFETNPQHINVKYDLLKR